MQGKKSNGDKTHEGSVKADIIIHPNQQTTVVISKLESQESNVQNCVIANLNDLFIPIPDMIELKMEGGVDQEVDHTIELGETEQAIKMDYSINMPIAFGRDFCIVYKDTIKDWHEKVKDLDVKHIKIEAEMDNAIPLELSLSGYAIDVAGRELTGITLGIRDNKTIQPCNEDDSPSTTSVIIEIEETGSARISEMDGIVLNVKAQSTETVYNKSLKSNQYIMLRKIKAGIPGGVILDMN
jgi:hypothetical protein